MSLRLGLGFRRLDNSYSSEGGRGGKALSHQMLTTSSSSPPPPPPDALNPQPHHLPDRLGDPDVGSSAGPPSHLPALPQLSTSCLGQRPGIRALFSSLTCTTTPTWTQKPALFLAPRNQGPAPVPWSQAGGTHCTHNIQRDAGQSSSPEFPLLQE